MVAAESYTAMSMLPYVISSAVTFLTLPYLWTVLAKALFPLYANWPRNQKVEWNARLNSMTHLLVIIPAVFYLVATDPALSSPDLFVKSWQASIAVSFSCGYFVWDLIEVVTHPEINGVPFIIHAIYCLGVYVIAAFGQMMLRHGLLYLLFEVSTVFLNLHWFFTVPYSAPGWAVKLNGLLLVNFWPDAMSLLYRVPSVDSLTYGMTCYVLVASVAANGLNTVWFGVLLKTAFGGGAVASEPVEVSKKG